MTRAELAIALVAMFGVSALLLLLVVEVLGRRRLASLNAAIGTQDENGRWGGERDGIRWWLSVGRGGGPFEVNVDLGSLLPPSSASVSSSCRAPT